MKKSLFLAIMALEMMAGCAKNEIAPVKNDQQITFQAVTGKLATKTMTETDGVNYPITVPFGTAAFFTPGNWANDHGSAGAYVEKSEVTFQENSYWSTAAAYYWPLTGNLTFFSFSPWGEGQPALNTVTTITNTDGVKITEWNVANNQTVDVMVADVAADKVANTETIGNWKEGVPTVFRHKLSQVVEFEIRTAADYKSKPETIKAEGEHWTGEYNVFIKEIHINNIKTVGTYTSKIDVNQAQLGVWTDQKTEADYPVYVAKNQTNDVPGTEISHTYKPNKEVDFPVLGDGNKYLLVLPQTFEDAAGGAQIVINYVVRQYYNSTQYIDTEKTGVALLYDVHTEPYYADHGNQNPGNLGEIKDGVLVDNEYAHQWLMNKKITYQLVIDLRDDESRIYWAPSIVDWDDEVIGEIWGEVKKEVSTEKELRDALKSGGDIKLTNNITLTEGPLDFDQDVEVVLDLNGKTIKNTTDLWNGTDRDWSLVSVNKGTVTIKGGTLEAKKDDCYAVDVKGGKVIIEDGTFVGNVSAVYVREGEAEIKGGTFSIQQLSAENDYRLLLNCYGEA